MKLIHGGDRFTIAEELGVEPSSIMDFSVNINPLGLPIQVRKVLIDQIEKAACYPDPLCRELVKALSLHHHVPESFILCGNGAADLIFRLVYLFQPKTALILAPTFAEYELALNCVACDVKVYELKEQTGFKVEEDFLRSLDENLDMVWLCNPNNPTGELMSKDFLLKILEKCQNNHTTVVVDECFMEFVEEDTSYSVLEAVQHYKNLVVLKAFTKFYSMAGLRLGYLLSSNLEMIEGLIQHAQPWSVSYLAQLAGVAALQDYDYASATTQVIQTERAFVKASLAKLGYKVYGSYANYIFFQAPFKNLKEQLEKKGVLIRKCDNYRGLHDMYYRIGLKNREQNEYLIHLLRNIEKGDCHENLLGETW